jgi:hypothetical protein
MVHVFCRGVFVEGRRQKQCTTTLLKNLFDEGDGWSDVASSIIFDLVSKFVCNNKEEELSKYIVQQNN